MAGQKKLIRVGSRKSPLALVQTHFVMGSIKQNYPNLEFELITMTTTGDEVLDVALSKIGEKNLFTRELEQALLDNKIDFVVHSLKDLPTQLPDNLVIGAVCQRDDPRDAVVMRRDKSVRTLAELPDSSVVGTSSLRRAAQLARKYPKLQIKDVRGNINTRFRKLDEDQLYDCLVLAAAGLERMKWTERISQLLDPTECMYAVAQGTMAVECRHGDAEVLEVVSTLNDQDTVLRCIAERAFLKELEGGCSVPVAVHTEVKDTTLSLQGGVYSIGGAQAVIDKLEVQLPQDKTTVGTSNGLPPQASAGIVAINVPSVFMTSAEQLGADLATKMLAAGADHILKTAKAQMAADIMKLKAEKAAASTAAKET